MTTYTAIASPDAQRGWLIRVPGLGSYPEDGLPTWARNLAEVEATTRDLIALWLEVPEASFSVEVKVDLPFGVRQHLSDAQKYADEAAHFQAAAANERRQAARELKNAGLTVRDIGAALGVSHQRAQQLLSA